VAAATTLASCHPAPLCIRAGCAYCATEGCVARSGVLPRVNTGNSRTCAPLPCSHLPALTATDNQLGAE